ncbi:RDD family protein [Ferruginibacter sp.]
MDNNDTIFTDLVPKETEASKLQAVLSSSIDFAIDIMNIVLSIKFSPLPDLLRAMGGESVAFLIGMLLLVTLYRFIFLVFFNKTIGMMITRIKLLNGNLKPLSTLEKLTSIYRTRFSKIKYYKDK